MLSLKCIQTNHIRVPCVFMLSKFKVQEERILSSAKLQISHFAGKKNKSMIKILKTRDPD